MLSLMTLALALFVLPLQFAYGDTSVPTPFGLVDYTLQVAYNGTLINPPALKIPTSIPTTAPTIGLTSSSFNDTYLIILVDPDAGKPEFIHWFQTNLTLSATELTVASLSFYPLLSTTPPLAPYVKPQPPPGTGFHRYIELLFSQPANFSIPANDTHFFGSDTSSRASFNVTSFARDAGLSKPVAANYFFAEYNTTGESQTAATGTASASRTATGGSGQATGTTQFTGDASHITRFKLSSASTLQAVLIMVCMLI